jgi:hypothetical protein
VKTLLPGQPVMLLREPWNPHDKEAVRVETLSGVKLGYVPRDHNNKFQVIHPLVEKSNIEIWCQYMNMKQYI